MTSSRTLLLAVLAVVAALIGPASASAGWFSIDENGNTTPNGHGNAPDEVATNGNSSSSSGGGYVMTEATTVTVNTGGSCSWRVEGRLLVRNPTVSGLADGDPSRASRSRCPAARGPARSSATPATTSRTPT